MYVSLSESWQKAGDTHFYFLTAAPIKFIYFMLATHLSHTILVTFQFTMTLLVIVLFIFYKSEIAFDFL